MMMLGLSRFTPNNVMRVYGFRLYEGKISTRFELAHCR